MIANVPWISFASVQEYGTHKKKHATKSAIVVVNQMNSVEILTEELQVAGRAFETSSHISTTCPNFQNRYINRPGGYEPVVKLEGRESVGR